MRNIHKKLAKYSRKCDELLLNTHLKELVNEAKENIEEIEVEDLNISDTNLVLVDVREPEEFSSGYINGCNMLTIPRGKLEFTAISKIAKIYGEHTLIVTYCLKGQRGLLAAYQLKKLGFTNVKNLNGGIASWVDKKNTIHNYLGEFRIK